MLRVYKKDLLWDNNLGDHHIFLHDPHGGRILCHSLDHHNGRLRGGGHRSGRHIGREIDAGRLLVF